MSNLGDVSKDETIRVPNRNYLVIIIYNGINANDEQYYVLHILAVTLCSAI